MNKLILSMAVAGALMLGATTFVAQDAEPVPVPAPKKAIPNERTAKDARRAEGEQMLGTFKSQARVAFAMSGAAPKTLTGERPDGCKVTADELKGKYFKVRDKVFTVKDEPGNAALLAEDHAKGDGFCLYKFDWAGGDGTFHWYDTLAALIEAHEDVTIEDKTTSSGDGETAEAEAVKDPYALYRKLGRKWKLKSTTTLEGMDPIISYMEYEVTKVTDTYAEYTMTMHDQDDKPLAGLEPFDVRVEFVEAEDASGTRSEALGFKKETKKVEAGEFECWLSEYEGEKLWESVQYPGLVVKDESKDSELELIEFSDGADKSEAKPDTPAEDGGEAKPIELNDFWERYAATYKKGRSWTLSLDAGAFKGHQKYEVLKVENELATVHTLTLDADQNPIPGVEPDESTVSLKKPDSEAEDKDEVEWVQKTIKVKAGEFECVSIDGETWFMKKYLAIIVKMKGSELVAFTE